MTRTVDIHPGNSIRNLKRKLLDFNRRIHRASRERIYLVSAAGQPNYGDEFIARSWLRFLARHKPDAEVWLDCPQPGRAASLFNNEHPCLRTTGTLWELASQAAGGDSLSIGNHVRQKVRSYRSPRVDIGIDILRGAGTLHAIGGGYINDIWPSNMGVIAGLVEASKISGARLFATGMGFLPLSPVNLRYLKELLTSFTYVESRDQTSASALNISLGYDDAFLGLALEQVVSREPDAPEIMILVQGDFFRDADSPWLLAKIRQFIDQHSQNGQARVGFVEAIPGKDRRYFGMLSSALTNAEFFNFKHVWTQGIPFRPGQKWLTSRFHMHLLAAAAGCPGVAISLDESYYSIKHSSLNALGTGWPVISPYTNTDQINVPLPALDPTFSERRGIFAKEKLALANFLYCI